MTTTPTTLIDGEQLIARQLAVTARTEVTFPDGRHTVLTPVSYTPQPADPALTLPLDGEWRMVKWPFAQAEDTLAAPGTGDAGWPLVIQPGKVFYQDHTEGVSSIPNWDRVGMTHIHPDDGAVLRRTVRLPQAWAGKRIFLRFDAIYPAGRVYLNGELLGEHTSGLTPVEFDVTGKVEPGGEAVVAVRLLRTHQFVKMDMPRHSAEFAGMAQSAYFFAADPCHIADYHLISSLDDAYKNGNIAGTVRLANQGACAEAGSLHITVTDADGVIVAASSTAVATGAGAEAVIPVALAVNAVRLWNDEFPHLYTVTLSLQLDGKPMQTISYRTGFRRLEFKDCRPLLNGNPVKFRGINHLTFHPEFGLHTPEAWLRQNLALMKKANINAIRTHFLGARCLADLCDEMGFYLMQELPIDWGTNYIHDPEWVGPALQRMQGGILRDRHHPSLVVWSVGNENMPESAAVAPDGYNHLRIYDRFAKTLDPSRPTMFPPPGPANKIRGIFEIRVGDIADIHYSFKLLQQLHETGEVTNPYAWTCEMETTTREEALARGWSGVWFSSEYGIMNMMPDLLNSPYGSILTDIREDPYSGKNSLQVFIDRLRIEWGLLRDDPTCLGGAYFPWLCSGTGNNPWGWVVWAEDNDWGVVTADLLPKPYFWALRVLFSPVSFPERLTWHKGETSLRFQITNLYNAIDLQDCTLRTQMDAGCGVGRNWQDISISCPPGESCTVEIPLWNPASLKLSNGSPVVVRCHLLDPTGFRPITADIMVVPEEDKGEIQTELTIGPDAKL